LYYKNNLFFLERNFSSCSERRRNRDYLISGDGSSIAQSQISTQSFFPYDSTFAVVKDRLHFFGGKSDALDEQPFLSRNVKV